MSGKNTNLRNLKNNSFLTPIQGVKFLHLRVRWIVRILQLLYKIYFALVFMVILVIMYPIFVVLLLNESWYSFAFRVKKFWSWLLRMLLFVPIVVKREEALPKGQPYIVCPNHSSYIDIIMMFGVLPEYFVFIGKAELLSWPLFNLVFRKMNIAVDRNSSRSGHEALKAAGNALDNGLRVIIFPEGGIPDSAPELGRFKNGAFKLAIEKQIPILPVTFLTNWKRLHQVEKLWSRSQPGLAKVITHEFIDTKGMTQDDIPTLREQVFKKIEGTLHDYEARRKNPKG